MLGRDKRQLTITSIDYLIQWGKRPLLPENSFYARLGKADDIFRDELFADAYSNEGAPSTPPSRLMRVLILQAYENISDRQAEQRALYDLRWKVALHLPVTEAGFDYSTLSRFRARLLLHQKTRVTFMQILRKAQEKGFLKKNELTQVLDSTYMFGRGAVEDTYTLISSAIRKLCRALKKRKNLKALLDTPLKLDYEARKKPKIDWEDPQAREALLQNLVDDAHTLVKATASLELTSEEQQLKNLLVQIIFQDIEEGEDDKVKIKQGVAKDRVISTTDPQMRHGRKSGSRRFDGYKAHIAMDSESELIVNVEVTPGNVHDAEPVKQLITNQPQELKPKTVVGDAAYGTGKLRHDLNEEEIAVIAPVPGGTAKGKITKADFEINLEEETCLCPGEKYAAKKGYKRNGQLRAFIFTKEQCQDCSLRKQCIKSKKSKKYQRIITLHPYEKELQAARAYQKTTEFKEKYDATRPHVERKIAELVRHGLRQCRYFGTTKTELQAILAAAVVNFKKLCQLENSNNKPLGQPI